MIAPYLSDIIDISEGIERERITLCHLRCDLMFDEMYDLRNVIADYILDLRFEQEVYCCILRMDVGASEAALVIWRDHVQSMLDEHMFGTPYEVFLTLTHLQPEQVHLLHGHDAIALHIAAMIRNRYGCLRRHIDIAREHLRIRTN